MLAEGAGHFIGTGSVGKGNFCIAAHSSVIYKEYFNNLKNVRNGMDIVLYDVDKNASHYAVSDYFYVQPSETWVLDDKGDDRVTLITCSDDGSQRLVVVGLERIIKYRTKLHDGFVRYFIAPPTKATPHRTLPSIFAENNIYSLGIFFLMSLRRFNAFSRVSFFFA